MKAQLKLKHQLTGTSFQPLSSKDTLGHLNASGKSCSSAIYPWGMHVVLKDEWRVRCPYAGSTVIAPRVSTPAVASTSCTYVKRSKEFTIRNSFEGMLG